MSCVTTFTGKRFDILNPRVQDVCIQDIIVSLSRQNRFNGHTHYEYNVAEHSVWVSMKCEDESGGDLSLAACGLMHDAAEAYIGDIVRPVRALFKELKAIELAILEVIFEKYGLQWPIPDKVFAIDDRMLMTERRDLISPEAHEWWPETAQPYEMILRPVKSKFSRMAFAERCISLEIVA